MQHGGKGEQYNFDEVAHDRHDGQVAESFLAVGYLFEWAGEESQQSADGDSYQQVMLLKEDRPAQPGNQQRQYKQQGCQQRMANMESGGSVNIIAIGDPFDDEHIGAKAEYGGNHPGHCHGPVQFSKIRFVQQSRQQIEDQ